MMIVRQPRTLDFIKQAHLSVKDIIRADEKISVGHPSPLAPSRTLLEEFAHFADDYLRVAGPNPAEEIKRKAQVYAWVLTNFEERYRHEVAARPEAEAELLRILAKTRRGLVVLLYSGEKDWPCHRLVLLDILREMIEKQSL